MKNPEVEPELVEDWDKKPFRAYAYPSTPTLLPPQVKGDHSDQVV